MGVGILTFSKLTFYAGLKYRFFAYFDNIRPIVILLALVPHNVNYKNNDRKLMTATYSYIPVQQ